MSFAVTDPDVPEMTFELFEQDARDILNHKIPNDLENWVSEKELAAFKKRSGYRGAGNISAKMEDVSLHGKCGRVKDYAAQ